MNGTWREKYLEALADQEKLEQQLAAHADMLRRTVTHLGAASSGLSQTLDAELAELRNKMRGAGGGAVNDQLLRVESAVKDWHQQREQHTQATCEGLQEFITALNTLRIDGHTQTALNKLNRSIQPKAVKLYEQAPWLTQLLAVYQQAIKVAKKPDQTLWEKLSNKTRLEGAVQRQDIENHELALKSETPAMNNAEDELDDPAAHETQKEKENIPHIVTINNTGEVQALLHDILSTIVPTEALSQTITHTRERLDAGVDHNNVTEFLGVIRDILQASYMNYGEEFSHYLLHMNDELQHITRALDTHLEDTARQLSQQLLHDQKIEDSQHQLADSQQQAASLDDLKSAVLDHVSIIQQALKASRQAIAEEQESHKKLKTVVEKVQQVETEAKASQALADDAKHQVNRDALTGLPNRAVCGRQLKEACQKFQSFNRPATIALCNIDGLSVFNEFGYIIGDRVLKLVAKTLQERLRPVDFAGRLNGDKFLMIMPELNTEDAAATLSKIGAFIAKTPLNIKGKPVQVTLSFGVTQFMEEDTNARICERLAEVLQALREAGGNDTQIC